MYYIYIITHGKNDKYGLYSSIPHLKYDNYIRDESFKLSIKKIIDNYNLYKKKKKNKT